MVLLDANVILRYLLNDNTEMAEKAERYIAAGDAVVTIEVIAEVVYVLKGVYTLERAVIAETVKQFLALADCRDRKVLSCALQAFGECGLDFVDCVLYAYHKEKAMEVATFDKQLLKMLER